MFRWIASTLARYNGIFDSITLKFKLIFFIILNILDSSSMIDIYTSPQELIARRLLMTVDTPDDWFIYFGQYELIISVIHFMELLGMILGTVVHCFESTVSLRIRCIALRSFVCMYHVDSETSHWFVNCRYRNILYHDLLLLGKSKTSPYLKKEHHWDYWDCCVLTHRRHDM